MDYTPLVDFLLDIPLRVIQFGSWLVTPLEYINMPPLAIFSIAGISIFIGIHLVRLFVGG